MPVLIPPSPQVQELSSADIIQAVVTKIQSGRKVNPTDLDDLNNAIQHTSMSDKTKTSIPFVNRDYITSCSSNPSTLVRYIGMVQDMLDPEYYVTKINGVSTKYREYYCLEEKDNDNNSSQIQDEMNHLLDERQPLVIVPIPHSTEVLHKCIGSTLILNEEQEHELKVGLRGDNDNEEVEQGRDMDTETETDTSFGRKRSLDLMDSGHTDDFDEKKVNREQTFGRDNENEKSTGTGKNDNNTISDGDWWPRGCMASQEEDCPILAKMYYQNEEQGQNQSQSQRQPQRRLQLNDIVEVYGILSVNPLGASFEDQHGNGNSNSQSCKDLNFDDQQEDFFMDQQAVLPPPSLLPRLHVLKYNILDLDDMVAHEVMQIQQASEPQTVNMGGDGDTCRQLAIDTFARHIFGGDKIAGEALLMAFMSLAERNERYGSKAIQMPTGATLGCGSLNFVLPDHQSCALLQTELGAIMKLIAPVAAHIQLSLSALDAGGNENAPVDVTLDCDCNIITSPEKTAANRLEPSVLQLPKSSCIVINEGALSEGTLKQRGQRTLAALSKMTMTHSIPYRFDGLMEIDFEADLRIIVLSCNNSSGRGSKLLPCSISVKVASENCLALDAPRVDTIPGDTILRILRYILTCRSNNTTDRQSISLPKDLLDRAQEDFIYRRKNNGSSMSRDIEEHDLHRWLLLTRLQARSRFGERLSTNRETSSMAKIGDWENALSLDDAMQAR